MSDGDLSVQRGLRSVFESMSISFVGTLVTRTSGFITVMILTNSLTESVFGVYVFVSTLVGILGTLAQFGTRESLMKLLPRYETARRNSVFGLAVMTVVAAAMILGLGLFIFAPALESYAGGVEDFVTVVRVFVGVMLFEGLRNTLASGFLGLELPKYGVAIDSVFSPLIRLTCIAVAVGLGVGLLGVSGGILVAAILTALAAVVLLTVKTELRPRVSHVRSVASDYYDFASTIILRRVGMILYTRSDIILLGFLASNTSVAVYKIAWILAVIVDLPLNGAGQVFPSIASRFYDEGRDEDLQDLLKTVTKWTFTASLFLFAGAVVFRIELLGLFGATYAETGVIVLLLMSFAQLVSNFVGPQGSILLMTGFERLNALQIWLFGAVTVALHFTLIPRFGLIGAAVAMFMTYVLLDVVQTIEVWYLRGYSSFSLRLWRPVACVIPTAGLMEVVRLFVGGVPSFLLGGVVGAVTYVALSRAFVIDETDRKFITAIRS